MRFDFSYLDMAFINGQIVTVNEKDEICQAVGIKKNKIVFVGTDEEIRRIIDEKTKVIDLKGRTMCPGFIDSHFHPILSGFMGDAILDATYPKCKSIEDIKELV